MDFVKEICCSFLNSLTSVRVFTRIVSDNPWCSLLAISSLRWKYNVTFIHCIPNHSWPEWMTINRCFFKWLWNLINFKKLFKLTNQRHIYWESAHILCSLRGVNVKVTSVHKLMRENTNYFFCFPRYQYSWGIGRYISMFLSAIPSKVLIGSTIVSNSSILDGLVQEW